MARPTKFTPEIIETIIKAVSIGATYKDAAEAAGCSYELFNDWMERGRKGDKKYLQFLQAIRKAESNARNNYLSTIAQAAAKGDWKAAAWYLSHRAKSDYGDNVDVTTGGDKVTSIKVVWQEDGSDDTTPPTA